MSPPSPLPPPRPSSRLPDLSDSSPTTTPPKPSGKSILGRIGTGIGLRIVIGLVIAGVIGIAGLLSNSKDVDDLAVGDCFADPGSAVEISSVKTIDCSEPHGAEVFHNGSIVGFSAFPGDDAVYDNAVLQCRDRFADYAGTDYDESALYLSAYTPTSDGWSQGDRGFSCVIVPEFGTLTGSARGSGL